MSIKLEGDPEDIDRLEQLLDDARKDRMRLDWVEKTAGRCGQCKDGFFAHPLAQGDKAEIHETLRGAIDAAIKTWGD